MRDIFALPPVTAQTTRIVTAAAEFVHQQLRNRSDARDIIKGLVKHHGARLTYPTYRTALRCGDIYTEGAASCSLATAKLLLDSFTEKASRYLSETRAGTLFEST